MRTRSTGRRATTTGGSCRRAGRQRLRPTASRCPASTDWAFRRAAGRDEHELPAVGREGRLIVVRGTVGEALEPRAIRLDAKEIRRAFAVGREHDRLAVWRPHRVVVHVARGEERTLAAAVACRDEETDLPVIRKDAGKDDFLRRRRMARGGQGGAGDNGRESGSHVKMVFDPGPVSPSGMRGIILAVCPDRSVCMDKHVLDRRDFLIKMAALGVAVQGLGAAAYEPASKLEITVSEVKLRRDRAGRMLMARIYQPTGAGPFPTVLDLMAARGTPRTARPKNRWIAPLRRAALSS